MLGLTILLVTIGGLFLLTAWFDKKIDKKDFSDDATKFGIILVIVFLLVLACLVEEVINYLILKIC